MIKRRLKTSVTADLVPMIDVVFQLVIFFMVSSTFIQTPGITINLPESSTAESINVGEIVITIDNDDTIFFNKDKVSLEQLDIKLSSFTKEQRENITSIMIETDKVAGCGALIGVVDALRNNDFMVFGMRTREMSE